MAYSEWITETNGVKWRYNSGNVITNQAAAEIVIYGVTYYGLYYYDRNWPGYGIRFQSNITSLESNPNWNETWHYYKKFKANTEHANTSAGGSVGTLSNDTSFYLATYWLASKDDEGNYPSKPYPMLVSTQTSSNTYWMQIEGLRDNTLTIIYHDGGGTPNTNYSMPHTTTVKESETYNSGWGLYNTTGSNSFGLRKIGYITNSGWNTKSDGTGKYIDETTDYTPAEIASLAGYDLTQGDVTLNLYPTWTPITYQIQYNSNGGSGTMNNSNHTYDEEQNLSKNAFVKTNYEFLGWSTSENGNVKYTDEQLVKNLTSADESTVYLYAIWGPKGSVMIYTNEGWKTALPFIYTEDGWSRALPYVFNNDSKWQLCNGDFKT